MVPAAHWPYAGVGGEVPGPGGGGCMVPGVVVSQHALRQTPPPVNSVNRITHTSKNITLATTSLRPVKMGIISILLPKFP